MTQEVSIITVNFNQTEATLELLKSIEEYAPGSEVIVIDNASLSDPGYEIRERFPNVIFIRSPENLGFAGGNNLGIKQATKPYLLFLNNDTVLVNDMVACLLIYLRNHSDIAGISPLIAWHNAPDTLQFAGYTTIHPITGRNRTIGENSRIKKYDPTPLPYLNGAAMMIRRSAIERVGLMSEEYFLYYEEFDWSCRFRDAGFRLQMVPCGPILHKGSLSTGRQSKTSIYYLNRNRILFMRRNMPRWSYVLFLCYYSLIALPWKVIRELLGGRPQNVRPLFSAYFWNL